MSTVHFANSASGPLAAGIGWFDFTGVSLTPNSSLILTNTLPNGGSITFTINNTTASGITFTGQVAPQRAGIPFGSTNYTGIGGDPLLNATAVANGTATLTLSNLTVTNALGATIPFGLVVAEGEGSVQGESWTWGTNGTPWDLIANIYGSLANISGLGTTTVTWGGANPWPSPVVSTNNPTSITGLDLELSNSAIALGVILTSLTLKKNVANRIYSNDQFDLSISGLGGATTITNGISTGIQSQQVNVFAQADTPYIINEAMDPSSTSSLSQYIQTVSIVNTSLGGTTIPANWTLGTPITVAAGDNITAIVTNTPINPVIKSTKTVNETFGNVNDTLTYTVVLTNTSPNVATNVTVTDTLPAGVTLVANSLTVNGVANPGNLNPPTGLSLLTLPGNSVTTITYSAIVNNSTPIVTPIKNSATTNYSYLVVSNTVPAVSTNTNITTTTISSAVVTSTKTVSSTLAPIGTIVTYTLTFKNSGNTVANNLVFVDTIPDGETLVPNSVTVNGNTRTGVSPNPPGFTITVPVTTLAAGAVITVAFKATITTTPNPNPILNTGALAYTFTSDPSVPNGNSETVVSNNVSTFVPIAPTAPLIKSVDLANAKIGDVLTYTIAIPNNGSVTAFNVILKDTIPGGTTFVSNSLTLNGVTQSGATIAPPTGFTIGTIAAGTTSTVTFNVTVVSVPATNPTPNSATTTFNAFTTTTIASSANSNIVTTTIVNASLTTTKTVSETAGSVGDIVTYTIAIKNTGSTTANNILFVDTIPISTTLVPNSFAINGVVQSGVSPAPPGTVIPDIGANGVTTVTFNVTLDTIPTPNPTTNTSTTGYSFTVPPSTVINATTNSNTVATFVNPFSNPLKVVSENFGSVGDILTYTISYKNNSSNTLTSAIFFDTIPSGTTFVPNSITVNGVSTTGTVSPPTGVTIPDLAPNAVGTVVFQVTVDTLPTPNPIPNEGFFEFSDFGTTIVKSVYSNTVTTEINQAIISPVSKTVDQVFAGLGDVLTYTINLYNSGNVTALNVVVSDTIPNGTTFVANSVTLNGTTQTGSTIAPPSGFTVGTIPAGQTATVAFQVTVVSIPTPNPTPNTATTTYDYVLYSATGTLASGSNNTNTVNTTVNTALVTSPVKTVDKAYTAIPATLTYTITMQNVGNTTALNLVFSDTIPTNTTFVPNSVTLNGVTQSGAVVAPPGFTVGTLAAGATATVTFQVTVNTIPTPNPILNSGTTNYSYVINPITSSTGTGSGNTNTASTTVNYADLSGSSKDVSETFGTCGDILTYTITIPNNGNVSAFNVFVQDTIPNGTVFVSDSVLLNGVAQIGVDPSSGVTIPSIDAGGVATLSFMVQVQC